MAANDHPAMQLETTIRSHNYYRNAVEKHWDPHEIDLEADLEASPNFPIPPLRASSSRSRCSARASSR